MNGFNGRTGLSQDDLIKYRSYVPGVDDVVWQPLYDYIIYPTAGALLFNFFSLQQGAGVTSAFGGAGTKTALDTNMQLSGQLGAGNQFLAMGIEVEFWAGSLPASQTAAQPTTAQISNGTNDVYSVLRNGGLLLTVQNRTYNQDAPLMKYPSQSRLDGWSSASNGANATASIQVNYAAGEGAAYNIVPVLLMQNQAFSVQIAFPVVIATPSGVDGRLGVRLNGKLIRNAQ